MDRVTNEGLIYPLVRASPIFVEGKSVDIIGGGKTPNDVAYRRNTVHTSVLVVLAARLLV